jgi:hypothetical protein
LPPWWRIFDESSLFPLFFLVLGACERTVNQQYSQLVSVCWKMSANDAGRVASSRLAASYGLQGLELVFIGFY